MAHYRWHDDTLLLQCHVQPGARRDAIVGLHGERLKIQIRAAPVDGPANACLIAFIAAQFGVAKGRVHLQQGDHSRQKTLAIATPQRLPDAANIVRPPLR